MGDIYSSVFDAAENFSKFTGSTCVAHHSLAFIAVIAIVHRSHENWRVHLLLVPQYTVQIATLITEYIY